jgi:hypothetical protein
MLTQPFAVYIIVFSGAGLHWSFDCFMEVAFAFLAKYAEFSQDALLTMVGGNIEVFRAATFPYLANFSVAARLLFTEEETRQEQRVVVEVVEAELRPPDGGPQPARAEMRLPASGGAPGQGLAADMVSHFVQVVFPRPGEYRVRLLQGDQERRVISLSVLQTPAAGG